MTVPKQPPAPPASQSDDSLPVLLMMDMVVTRCPGFLAGSAEDETALDGPTQKTGAEMVAVVLLSAEETV